MRLFFLVNAGIPCWLTPLAPMKSYCDPNRVFPSAWWGPSAPRESLRGLHPLWGRVARPRVVPAQPFAGRLAALSTADLVDPAPRLPLQRDVPRPAEAVRQQAPVLAAELQLPAQLVLLGPARLPGADVGRLVVPQARPGVEQDRLPRPRVRLRQAVRGGAEEEAQVRGRVLAGDDEAVEGVPVVSPVSVLPLGGRDVIGGEGLILGLHDIALVAAGAPARQAQVQLPGQVAGFLPLVGFVDPVLLGFVCRCS